MKTIDDLTNHIPQTGRVRWIGISSMRLATIQPVREVAVKVGTGLEGDHHAAGNSGSKRQVTLIQQEHIPVIAALTGKESIDPRLLRRNIVVSGINLIALKDKRFRIGEVLLEGTGPCAPCSRMEENLEAGGYNAMRGHGGICTRVIEPGYIHVGDKVHYVGPAESNGADEVEEADAAEA